jgi:hypothetical protein
MSTIITNISCTPYYQIILSYGVDCTSACGSPYSTTYYTNCSILDVGCSLLDQDGTDAPLGYYSDGAYCYVFGLNGELSEIITKSTCLTESCGCFGYSTTSCEEANVNFVSCD